METSTKQIAQKPRRTKAKPKKRKSPKPIAMTDGMRHALRCVKESQSLPSNSSLADNIPMYRDVFTKGTQNPVLRLHTTQNQVASSAGSVVNTVQFLSFGQILGFGDWNNIFDEYRFIRARFEYIPYSYHNLMPITTTTWALMAPIVGVVDYESSTALASLAEGLGYQTAKIFSPNERVVWEVDLDWAPDTEWISSQTTGTVVASVKLYGNNLSASQAYGAIYGQVDVQFRQAYGS